MNTCMENVGHGLPPQPQWFQHVRRHGECVVLFRPCMLTYLLAVRPNTQDVLGAY